MELYNFADEISGQVILSRALKLTKDLVETKSLVYNYPHQDVDPERRFKTLGWPLMIKRGNKSYIAYPELFAVISYPFVRFELLEWIFLLNLIPALLSLYLFNLLLDRIGIKSYWFYLASFAYLLNTSVIHHAFSYSEFSIALFTGFSGLYLFVLHAFREEKSNLLPLIFSGILFGISFMIRQEAAIPAFFSALYLFVYSARENCFRLRISSGLIGFSFAFLLMVTSYVCISMYLYNLPLGLRVSSVFEEDTSRILKRLIIIQDLLFFGDFRIRPAIGFFAQLPYLLILFYRPISRFRRIENSIVKFLFAFTLFLLITIPLIAPNDGWGGFGSRYLMQVDAAALLVFFYLFSIENGSSSTKGKIKRSILYILIASSTILFLVSIKFSRVQAKLMEEQHKIYRGTEIKTIVSLNEGYYWGGTSIFNKHILEATSFQNIPYLMKNLEKANKPRFCVHFFKKQIAKGPDGLKHVRTVPTLLYRIEKVKGIKLVHKGETKNVAMHCFAIKE